MVEYDCPGESISHDHTARTDGVRWTTWAGSLMRDAVE
jgi:hypothetical protein